MTSPYRILVIDDCTENRESIADLLETEGYDVRQVENGDKALVINETFQPHLYVLDVVMPGMSGLELLRRFNIQELPATAIIITGYESIDDARCAMECGAFTYLTKPVPFNTLKDQVAKALATVELKQWRHEYHEQLEEDNQQKMREYEDIVEMLKNQSMRFDIIINSMDEGLLAIDPDDNVVLMNRHMEKILGLTFAQCAAQSLWSSISDGALKDQLWKIIRGEPSAKHQSHFVEISSTENEQKYYLVKTSLIVNDRNDIIGIAVNFINQTEKVKAERLRTSFFSIVAHELRTPLNVSMNYLSFVKQLCPDNETAKDITHDMWAINARLKYLVNSIIHLAHLSGTGVPVNPVSVNVGELIESCRKDLTWEAENKNIACTLTDELNGTPFLCDKKLLKMILISIISNAMKFNKPDGTVSIRYGITDRDTMKQLCIEVTDQGDGFPHEMQDKIFSAFTQGEHYLTRQHGGIGVGLYIAKQATDRLNGSLKIQTLDQGGTRVLVTIPLPTIFHEYDCSQETCNGKEKNPAD